MDNFIYIKKEILKELSKLIIYEFSDDLNVVYCITTSQPLCKSCFKLAKHKYTGQAIHHIYRIQCLNHPKCSLCNKYLIYRLRDEKVSKEVEAFVDGNLDIFSEMNQLRLYCLINTYNLRKKDIYKLCRKFLPDLYDLFLLVV